MGRRAAVVATIATTLGGTLLGITLDGAAVAEEPLPPDPVEACVVDELLVNSCRPWFGASAKGYPQVAAESVAQLEYFEERAGRAVDVAHTYHPLGENDLDPADHYFAARPGTYLLTSWKPAATWAAAAGGNVTVDAGIDEMAASIKSLGDVRVFLVVHHEPENDVTTTSACADTTRGGRSGTPEDYRAMWANVRARFDAAGVTNVVWVVNYMGSPDQDCVVDALYPGDDLVDWVTFNAYQHNDDDVSFEARVRQKYDLLTANSAPGHDYLSKPWGVLEWGIHNSTQRNAYDFYVEAAAAVEAGTFPQLRMYLVWDSGANGDGSHRVSYARNGVLDLLEQSYFNRFAGSLALSGAGLPPDLEPPSATSDLAATVTSSGAVALQWSPASDDIGVTGYQVLRNGEVVARTWTPGWTDYWPPDATTHDYAVRALDASGKAGEASVPVPVTIPDRTPPSVPTSLQVVLVGGVPTLSWAPSSDNVAVSDYDVYRDGAYVATVVAPTYADPVASQGRSHTWRIRARDEAGNVSALGSGSSLFVPDRTAPTAPASLQLSRSSTSARLTWTAATDNVGVTGYIVTRGTTVVARLGSSARAYTVNGLRAGTRYTFGVAARDAAGNVGPARTVIG